MDRVHEPQDRRRLAYLCLVGALLSLAAVDGCGGSAETRQRTPSSGPSQQATTSPYERGSLVRAVDAYVADEEKTVKQIQEETFEETLLATSDWKTNYEYLNPPGGRDLAGPLPTQPAGLKLIVYSHRYAKLVEVGRKGLTEEQIRSVTELLHADLVRWCRLWSQGQRIRGSHLLHSPTQSSDELIVPLTFRINTTMLLVGQLSLREALPAVIEAADVLGIDTNWSAAGFACDRVLMSLDPEMLSAEQRDVLARYRAWRAKEAAKLLEYEEVKLPSFAIPRFLDGAPIPGEESQGSTATVTLLLPPQYRYMSNEDGYFDLTGNAEVLKKVAGFAREYCNTETRERMPSTRPPRQATTSPYEQGSLIYAVDRYVADVEKTVKQIQKETFEETLRATSDWTSNYRTLVLPDIGHPPSHPVTLKLIVYSRRFAKLINDGHGGLTNEQVRGVGELLRADLVRWRRLRSEGQSLHGAPVHHSPTQRSEELIIPLTFRINATMLFVGQSSLREALPAVIEAVDVLGADTNWSAAGFACDRVLMSLDPEMLSAEQRDVLARYRAWRAKEGGKLLEYKTLELPSYDSLRRPGDRATSLGVASDDSTGTVSILLPPQYSVLVWRGVYENVDGSMPVLRRVVDFAREYCNAGSAPTTAPGPTPCTQPLSQPATQPVPPDERVGGIVLGLQAEAAARSYRPLKSVEDARIAQQAEEDPYIESLRNESFVEGLRRVHGISELFGELEDLPIIRAPDNPCIVESLSKSRRFSKLLAYVRDSRLTGDVKRVVEVLHENAQWYLAARAEVEQRILKMMADRPELFRAGVELSERQTHDLVDVFDGFGTTERVGLNGAAQGLAAISFLLGESEDVSAVGPLLEIADRDDAPFFQELDKPGNRRMYPCSTANREVIADALDRILVAEAGRAAADSPTGRIAREYLRWRQEATLPERKTVSVYPYDRPRAEAKTMPLSLPMMEPMRLARPLSEEMAKKVDTIIEYARRLGE